MITTRHTTVLTLSLALFAVLAVACSQVVAPTATSDPVADLSDRPDFHPLVTGEESADGLQVILGTGDLAVGEHRVGFVLTSDLGIVVIPTATVASSLDGTVRETVTAELEPWPYGSRGLYVADMTFGEAGAWSIDISVDWPGGSVKRAALEFEVAATTSAPAIGAPAIPSVTKTIDDVDDIVELTTGSLHDAELYQLTLAEAVTNGDATVVVFASPAFCINAVCGPQVDVLQEMKDVYQGQANFVHVDFYENPHEIEGDLYQAVISQAVRDWSLPSIEWTFVIDGQGIVAARFEGFATYDEVEEALLGVL